MPAADAVGSGASAETWAVHLALPDECLAVSRRQLVAVRETLER